MDSKRSKLQSAGNKSPLRRKQQSYHSFRREAAILRSQLLEVSSYINHLASKTIALKLLHIIIVNMSTARSGLMIKTHVVLNSLFIHTTDTADDNKTIG